MIAEGARDLYESHRAVSTPMGVGGWQRDPFARYPPLYVDGVMLRPGIVPECRERCCEPFSGHVREMVRVYGPAFFSDGMGV